MKRAEVGVILFLLSIAGLWLPVALEANSEAANRVKCANNLRQLGLAAIQYGDDKRFLPHHNRILTADGDHSTNHTPKVIRALLWYGYHDDPAGWICPSSDDQSLRVDKEVRENMRKWGWNRKHGKALAVRSPFVHGTDPALNKTTELSYAYRRKACNSNVRSTAVLAADRAARDGKGGVMRGNHAAGWNVLFADGTVRFKGPTDATWGDTGAFLSTPGRGKGLLSVRPQTAASFKGLKEKKPTATGWAGYFTDGSVIVRLEGRAWAPYRGVWRFAGALERKGRTFPLNGEVGAGGKLTGTIDTGKRNIPFTANLTGKKLALTSEGFNRTVKRATDPRVKLVKAFLSVLKKDDQAAADALLTQRSVRRLYTRRANWFATMRQGYLKMNDTQRAATVKRLTNMVVREDGKLKINLR